MADNKKYTCRWCKKEYKYASGLSRHKNQCKSPVAPDDPEPKITAVEVSPNEWKEFIINEIKRVCDQELIEEFMKKSFKIMRENEDLKLDIDRMKEYNEEVVLPGIESFRKSSKEQISELESEVSRLKAKITAYET